jgi:hypothetical protein
MRIQSKIVYILVELTVKLLNKILENLTKGIKNEQKEKVGKN